MNELEQLFHQLRMANSPNERAQILETALHNLAEHSESNILYPADFVTFLQAAAQK